MSLVDSTGKRKEIMSSEVELKGIKPNAGDVLWANRMAKGLPYNHCGIYIGEGRIIHFAAPDGAEISQENAVIHETSYDNFSSGCEVKIIGFKECYTPEETVKRAQSRLGEKGYNFLTNNCDHFATWCKTGKHQSLQVEGVKVVIKMLGGEKGELVCDLYSIAEDFRVRKHEKSEKIDGKKEEYTAFDLDLVTTGLQVLATGGKWPSMPNIQSPTMGGEMFWNELANVNGWRVQQNRITHHCRVLNPNNERVAWGGVNTIMGEFERLVKKAE